MGNLLTLVVAYFLGAIPTGLLIGKLFRGIDLRDHGSRNIGFTNAVRVMGWKLGAPVLVLDVLKAYFAAAWAAPLIAGETAWPMLPLLAGMSALIGNTVNVFLGFKGGKGVATGLGVFLGLAPIPVLIALLAFGLTLGVTRFVSLGSIVASIVLVIGVGIQSGFSPLLGVTAVAAAGIMVKHRANISRLLAGTESRIGDKTKAETGASRQETP